MAQEADPYRTLGLSRGATADEVKLAYRRLAKANHPDAAGPSALPRFLAIQAAYEQLNHGAAADVKRRRTGPRSSRPWETGPDPNNATRRAYGGRARSTPPGARGAPPDSTGGAGTDTTTGATGATRRSGRARTSEARSGPPRSAGSTGRAGPAGDPSARPDDRPSTKATFGSTSYDGAEGGPFEPDWGGASWYGTTSGTYWTLNPKEYADPRKHGPEYQARARRAARTRAGADAPDAAALGGDGPDATGEPAPSGGSADPTHTTSTWWDSTAGATGPPGAAGPTGPMAGPPQREERDDRPPPDLGRAAADIVHALTDDRFGGPRGRLGRAIIGWLPIALGLGWLIGELTGCGRFAASCDGAGDPVLLGLQVAVFAVLLIVPALASVTTAAAVTLFVAAVSTSLLLSASGGAADGDARRAALGAVLLIAWLIGLGIGTARRAHIFRSAVRPVS